MPNPAVKIGPDREAADNFRRKTVAPTSLSSAQIEREVSVAAREAAFFSAKVRDAQLLSAMKQKIQAALDLDGRPFVGRATFVADIRKEFDAMKGDSGKLTDIESDRRLSLIYNTNVEMAYERARWARDNGDADVLNQFPCQELVRVENRERQRDWKPRWGAAGGRLFGGRMIARKDSPVWTELSRFGTPWPPFDFGSGMGVRDIDREEAIRLGVIKAEETVEPNYAPALKNDLAKRWEDLRLDPDTQDALAATLPAEIRETIGTDAIDRAFRRAAPECITSRQLEDYARHNPDDPRMADIKIWGDDEKTFTEMMNENTPKAEKWRENMGKIINSVKPDDLNRPIWRGWQFKNEAAQQFVMNQVLGETGFTNTRPGMSGSYYPEVSMSEKFLGANNGLSVVWEIVNPSTARNFAPVLKAVGAKYPEQREAIFPKGSTFRIAPGTKPEVRTAENGTHYTHIQVQELTNQ